MPLPLRHLHYAFRNRISMLGVMSLRGCKNNRYPMAFLPCQNYVFIQEINEYYFYYILTSNKKSFLVDFLSNYFVYKRWVKLVETTTTRKTIQIQMPSRNFVDCCLYNLYWLTRIRRGPKLHA